MTLFIRFALRQGSTRVKVKVIVYDAQAPRDPLTAMVRGLFTN
jgi:hypothetical protein